MRDGGMTSSVVHTWRFMGETRRSIYNIVNMTKSRLKSKPLPQCKAVVASASDEEFCGAVQATVSLSQRPEKAMLMLLFGAACQAGLMRNSLSQTELSCLIFPPSQSRKG